MKKLMKYDWDKMDVKKYRLFIRGEIDRTDMFPTLLEGFIPMFKNLAITNIAMNMAIEGLK